MKKFKVPCIFKSLKLEENKLHWRTAVLDIDTYSKATVIKAI